MFTSRTTRTRTSNCSCLVARALLVTPALRCWHWANLSLTSRRHARASAQLRHAFFIRVVGQRSWYILASKPEPGTRFVAPGSNLDRLGVEHRDHQSTKFAFKASGVGQTLKLTANNMFDCTQAAFVPAESRLSKGDHSRVYLPFFEHFLPQTHTVVQVRVVVPVPGQVN